MRTISALRREYGRDLVDNLVEQFGEHLVRVYDDEGFDLEYMDEAYQGEFESDEAFVMDLLRETGIL